jgi:hypothetical protein
MAKVLGEAGRYVSQQTIRKSWKAMAALGLGAYLCAFLCGVVICLPMRTDRISFYVSGSVSVVLLLTIIVTWRVANRKFEALEKERLSMRKGAVGEAAVALILNDFPDEFWIIHDLTTPFGNLDHVVVGPTGVYLVDTKNWKGIVSADGQGELLLNGKPTDKATVKPIVGRTLAIRDKVLSLSSNNQVRQSEAPFFHAVLAFPSAKVEARWGSTGVADCVSDEKLWDYIVEDRKGRSLPKEQVESYARAFRALAQMDGDFEAQPSKTST